MSTIKCPESITTILRKVKVMSYFHLNSIYIFLDSKILHISVKITSMSIYNCEILFELNTTEPVFEESKYVEFWQSDLYRLWC